MKALTTSGNNSGLTRPLRIAHIACGCNLRGGIERGMYELCRRQAAEHDVHIFAEDCELDAKGVTFHRVRCAGHPWALRHLMFFLRSAQALRPECKRAPFDIVHGHAPCAVRCDVMTAHSVYATANARIKANLSLPRRMFRNARTADPMLEWLSSCNFQRRRCTRAIAISEGVRRELMSFYALPEDRIDVIYRGVDSERFSPALRETVRPQLRARLGIAPDQLAAIFVGNTFMVKGFGTLLHAMNRIPPAERPHLIVVGETTDRDLSLAQAKRMAGSLGVSAHCHFIGKADHVEEVYAAADFLAFPTLYEPFGQVITEAMASGLPVVTSRLAGAAELISDGREGLLIEKPGDAGEVAARMRELAARPELRRRMGQAGRSRALEFSWDREAALHMACYQKVFAERHRRTAAAPEAASRAPQPRSSNFAAERRAGRGAKGAPLRIAQITFACHRRGGIERVAYEISRRFAGKGHEVHVFAGDCDLEAEGVVFHKLPVIRRPWPANQLGFFIGARAALSREEARAGKFDIVHVQGIPAWIDADVATAHSVHRVGTALQNALLPASSRFCHRLKTVDPLIQWMAAYNFRPGHSRRVIAISASVKQDVAALFGMPPERIDVVHNGVDTVAFSPERRAAQREAMRASLGLPSEAPVAIFVANEFHRKGLDVLIEALAQIEPARRPLLLVVGDSRDHTLTRADCERLCASLRVEPWVQFTGATPQVEKYFAAADFLALPTIYEPFGLVILEALATGIPAVFSRRAGAADIVVNGREALLLEDPRNPREIAAALLALSMDPALRARIGAAARQAALRYAWDRVAERTLDCYETVLSERRAAQKTRTEAAL